MSSADTPELVFDSYSCCSCSTALHDGPSPYRFLASKLVLLKSKCADATQNNSPCFALAWKWVPYTPELKVLGGASDRTIITVIEGAAAIIIKVSTRSIYAVKSRGFAPLNEPIVHQRHVIPL